MLFARSNVSSGVRNVITLNTGPKISSDATRGACVTPVRNVGGNAQLDCVNNSIELASNFFNFREFQPKLRKFSATPRLESQSLAR